MSDLETPTPADPSGLGPEVRQSLLGKYDLAQKAGGLIAPVLTAVLAFFVGGLVVFVTTGKNPLTTYRAIFDGAGFNWFFPWVTGDERSLAALNLQQTLILTTSLILTGLAVAFAFRCGLFNIGGTGQYIVRRGARRLDRLLVRGHELVPPHPPRDGRGDALRRSLGGHRRAS